MEILLNEKFDKLEMSGSTQWYDVKVNVEADNLNDIEQVQYFLDRSVSPSILVSENSDNKFEVQIQSWKEFPVSAKVTFKDHNISPVFVQTEYK